MPRAGYERFDGSGPSHESPPSTFVANDEDEDVLPTTSIVQPGLHARHDTTPHRTQHRVDSDERSRWDSVKDLDHFFTSMYKYQQRGGFGAIVVDDVLQLLQFVFIISFATFLTCCVDYGVLFNDKLAAGHVRGEKRSIADVIISDSLSHLPFVVVVGLFLSVAFLVVRLVRLFYQASQHYDMRACYSVVLGIEPEMLDNLTWHEVMNKLIRVQKDVKLCINASELTELDVYQRILRYKNYTVAMVNMDVLPVRYHIPFVGSAVYLTESFKANMQWLLFTGPFSPWRDFFTVRAAFKDREQLDTLADEMERVVLVLGCLNAALMPLIFVWQILYSFCVYAQLMKRQPGALGMKCWSNYARLSLRHLNELPHELHGRLCRAHRPATMYMDQFTTHLTEVIAKFFVVIAASIFGVLAVLSAWDEDVLQVEHVITIMALCGGVVFAGNVFIMDENMVYHPHLLMDMVTAHVHYIPDEWKDSAHSESVRYEFSHLFEFRIFHLLEELFSPLITPFVLIFWLRPRARQFVQFFHDYTVTVPGIGDVCSFAQMETGGRHGDKEWQMPDERALDSTPFTPRRAFETAANGKLELSCVHFALNNPGWMPPPTTDRFLHTLRDRALTDAQTLASARTTMAHNAMAASIVGVSMERSVLNETGALVIRGRGVNNIAGPPTGGRNDSMTESSDLLRSLHEAGMMPTTTQRSGAIMNMSRFGHANHMSSAMDTSTAAAEMSVHALYLREIHRRTSTQNVHSMHPSAQSTTDSIASMIRPPGAVVRMREMEERSPIKTQHKTPNYSSTRAPSAFESQTSSTGGSHVSPIVETRSDVDDEELDDGDEIAPVWGARLVPKPMSPERRAPGDWSEGADHDDDDEHMPPNSFSAN